MFCQKCGQQVPDGSMFCTHCGASLAGGSVPTPTGAGPSSAPGLTQSMPPVAPAPQKPKSKAPVIIAVACAAVVLLGGGTVFALTMLNGSKSSDTQISVIDTGSSDEKDSPAKKKDDKSKAKQSSSSDDEAVPEDESAYYGSGDSDDYLTDVYTYTNDMHPYSMSIPNRFEMEDTPSGSGARYEDPETGFVINLFGYVNINEETAHEMFVDADTSGKADLYTAEGDNWYVARGRYDHLRKDDRHGFDDCHGAFGVLDCKPRHGVEDYRYAAADVSGGLDARAYSRQSETPIARAPDSICLMG